MATAIAMVGSAVMGIVAGNQSADAAKLAGKYGQNAKEYEARQYDQEVGQSMAVAQRNSIEEKHHAELVASRALAVAGASGAGASDPTVMKIVADINGEGAYRQALALYQGEDQARKYRMAAKGARIEGEAIARGADVTAKAYETQGRAAGIKGAISMYGKYGGGTPAKGTNVQGNSDYVYDL